MKAWAAAVRGSPKTFLPCFEASELFPNDPCLQYSVPSKLLARDMLSTKRFVFDSMALALLKSQQICSNLKSLGGTTRMEATTSIIWKAAAKAASSVRQFSPQSPHALLSAVNLRIRASPAMATNSIGNLILLASAICFPESQPDLPTLMGKLKQSIVKIDADLIETIKGKKGHETFKVLFKSLTHLANVTEVGDIMFATSILNSGIYELDFGWGKLIWFYVANEGVARFVILTDMLKGGGVEAIVTLSRDEMEIFERDTELLSYATVDPSPLLFLNR